MGTLDLRYFNQVTQQWEAPLANGVDLDAVALLLEQHKQADNPHNVTAEQLGLGNVQNFTVATQAEAEAGTSAVKYLTPQRGKQLFDKNLMPLQEQVTSHLAQTNPHAETANRTINVGATREHKTVQSAIDSLRKDLGGKVITIYIDTGDYTSNGLTKITGFHNGELNISSALVTSTSVTLSSIDIKDCNCRIGLSAFTLKLAPPNLSGVNITGCVRVICQARIIADNPEANTAGLNVVASFVYIQDTEISKLYRAIVANNAMVNVQRVHGTGNIIGLSCTGGILTYSGGVPSAATEKETSGGGIINP